MTAANTTSDLLSGLPDRVTQLSPSFGLPIAFVLIALPLLFVQIWVAVAFSLFGLFLMYQAATLRLVFTATDLDIYRSETQIRRFPYQEWQAWQIFWSGLPILFYFKEVKSIHFLPILFDAKTLEACLERHIPPQA
ncbi:DUF3119 domain-containing protein [Tumidithrix helvetica PCC 7403]|uniref:DUF3119 family protein n=1 Tax=Tumidithrix helvetica TaxID=3457545 RepID=UPI003C8FE84D